MIWGSIGLRIVETIAPAKIVGPAKFGLGFLIFIGFAELVFALVEFYRYLKGDSTITTSYFRTFLVGMLTGPLVFIVIFVKISRKTAFAAAAGTLPPFLRILSLLFPFLLYLPR